MSKNNVYLIIFFLFSMAVLIYTLLKVLLRIAVVTGIERDRMID
jgi:hypothetical protein